MFRFTKSWVLVTLTAMLAVVLPGAPAYSATTPIYMEDGSIRRDVQLVQTPFTDQYWVTNLGDSAVRVDYTDPTYGPQSAIVEPAREVALCANEAFSSVASTLVTYNVGTSDEVHGIGWYLEYDAVGVLDPSYWRNVLAELKPKLKVVNARVAHLSRRLEKAKATTERARASGKKLWIKNSTRWLKKLKVKLKKARAKKRSFKIELVDAKKRLQTALEEVAYCAERRIE